MRFQTGALKQGRNTDSQAARIGGTRCRVGRHRGARVVRCHYSCRVEVEPAPQESLPSTPDIRRQSDLSCAVMTDPIINSVSKASGVAAGNWSLNAATAATRSIAPAPGRRSPDCVSSDRTIVSRYSTGRYGRNAGPAPARSGGPSCPSTTRCTSSLQRTSSGLQDNQRGGRKCGKSS